LKTKLEALSNVGTGNVSVSGSAGGPYTVEFIGELRSMSFQAMDKATDATFQASGAGGTVTVAVTQVGSHAVYSRSILNVPHTLWMQNGNTGDADSQIHVSIVGHERRSRWLSRCWPT
jgi:hypothetical protein